MRVRVFENSSSEQQMVAAYTDQSGSINTSSKVHNASYDIYHDVVVENFHKLKNQGNLFFNPQSRYTMSYKQDTHAYAAYSGQRYGVPVGGGCTWNIPLSVPEVDNLDHSDIKSALSQEFSSDFSIALTQAFSNIDESELLIAASVGELPETIKWLTSLFRRFVKLTRTFLSKKVAINLLKSARKLTAKQATSDLADLWLEYRYAVRPLLFEAQQAAEAFNKELALQQRFTARGHQNNTSTSSENVDVAQTYTGWCTTTFNTVVTSTYNARAGALYQIELSDERDWSVILGLDKPFSVLWELTGGSFIFDWFFNLGQVISMWEQNPSLVVKGAWVSETWTLDKICQLSGVALDSSWTYPYTNMAASVSSPGTARLVQRWQCRTVDVTKPILPHVRVNLDCAKLIDLAAIARGLFLSR